jgi:MtN3 and saliva related transmembrane protein
LGEFLAVELIGWLSALVLLTTIGKQVYKQWRSGSTEGVSSWLFIGQTVASFGFAVYSGLTRNWVFLCVNAALLCSGIAGQLIYRRNLRRQQASAARR